MQGQYLIIGSIVLAIIIVIVIVLYLIKKTELNYYKDKIKNLEVQRNLVASTPVLLELSKVEPIIKNDKMEEKYNKWQDRFAYIREHRLTQVDDMLIDLDLYIDKRDYKTCSVNMAKIEIEIYKTSMIINIIAGIIVFVLCAGIIGSPTLLFIWIRKKIKKKKENIL